MDYEVRSREKFLHNRCKKQSSTLDLPSRLSAIRDLFNGSSPKSRGDAHQQCSEERAQEKVLELHTTDTPFLRGIILFGSVPDDGSRSELIHKNTVRLSQTCTHTQVPFSGRQRRKEYRGRIRVNNCEGKY